MNEGLTNKEIKTFKDILIKANDIQIIVISNNVKTEILRRQGK